MIHYFYRGTFVDLSQDAPILNLSETLGRSPETYAHYIIREDVNDPCKNFAVEEGHTYIQIAFLPAHITATPRASIESENADFETDEVDYEMVYETYKDGPPPRGEGRYILPSTHPLLGPYPWDESTMLHLFDEMGNHYILSEKVPILLLSETLGLSPEAYADKLVIDDITYDQVMALFNNLESAYERFLNFFSLPHNVAYTMTEKEERDLNIVALTTRGGTTPQNTDAQTDPPPRSTP